MILSSRTNWSPHSFTLETCLLSLGWAPGDWRVVGRDIATDTTIMRKKTDVLVLGTILSN